MSFEFDMLFPYPVPRKEQKTAIEFTLDAFYNRGKRFVIIEAGTGVGKSGIGVTVSRYIDKFPLLFDGQDPVNSGTWFLTTQKILQDQYVRDFGPPFGRMKSVKSAANYQCKFRSCSCEESRQLLKGESVETKFYQACSGLGCVYAQARKEWQESLESVTNFSYFMALSNFSKCVNRRRLMVIDEAHNVESELSKFINVSVSELFAKRILKLHMPILQTQHQAVSWIRDVYFPKVNSHLAHVEQMLTKFNGLKDKVKQILSLSRQLDLLQSHCSKMKKFLDIYDKDNWVMNLIPAVEGRGRRIEFKVIDVSPFSEEILFRFGEKILMMSSTILDVDAFCEGLGIPREQSAFLEIPSPFPVENRPILYVPVGRMSRNNIDTTLPKLVKQIRMILEHHEGEKGIIHTHTFRIANYLARHLKSSRILVHDSANREHILEEHLRSNHPTVLLTPSMTEGVDLKDDVSRFQVICKIPYPYLGDSLVRKRMSRWKWWYSLQAVKTIVQASGRSVRNMNDYAVTYILDEDWHRFYESNQDMFPLTFKSALC